MNTNKILMAGLAGALVAFILGYLTYGMLLTDFFQSNSGSATGVMRSEADLLWIPLILGHVTWGMIFAVIFGRWANISTFATGAKAGAVLGLLIGLTFDLINLGTTNILNVTGTIGDVVLGTVLSAIVGGVVAWVLGKDAK